VQFQATCTTTSALLASCTASLAYSLDGVSHPYTGTFSVNAPGAHTIVFSNNLGSTVTKTFQVDANAPTIAPTSPADGAVFPQGTSAKLQFTCADGDSSIARSGVAATNGCSAKIDGVDAASGATLPSAPGQHTIVFSAKDNAGNTSTQSRTYYAVAPPTVATPNITGLPSLPLLTTTAATTFRSASVAGPHAVRIDWGDGTSTTCTAATPTSSCSLLEPPLSGDATVVGTGSITAKHVYGSIGLNRTITVTVTNKFGSSGSASVTRLL
jgi:hypothetical protein